MNQRGASQKRRRRWPLVVVASLIGLLLAVIIRPVLISDGPERDSPRAASSADPSPVNRANARANLNAIRQIVASQDPLVISVVGDSTGNDSDEWVAGWASRLAEHDATATLHRWDPSTESYASDLAFGDGDRDVVIWNASMPGMPADAALPLVRAIQPDRPDMVLFNFGHNRGEMATGTALEQLTATMESRWGAPIPIAAMLQNPGLNAQAAISEAGRLSVANWATVQSIPVIDVHAAFVASTSWSTRLMRDDAHPNEHGSQLWATTLTNALE